MNFAMSCYVLLPAAAPKLRGALFSSKAASCANTLLRCPQFSHQCSTNHAFRNSLSLAVASASSSSISSRIPLTVNDGHRRSFCAAGTSVADLRQWSSFNSSGLHYLQQGQLESAAAMFLAAMKDECSSWHSPHRFLSLANLGITFKRQEKKKEALDALTQAAQHLLNFPALNHRIPANIWRELAMIYEEGNDWKNAFDAYRQAVTLYEKYHKIKKEEILPPSILKKIHDMKKEYGKNTLQNKTSTADTSASALSLDPNPKADSVDEETRFSRDEANCRFSVALIAHRNPSFISSSASSSSSSSSAPSSASSSSSSSSASEAAYLAISSLYNESSCWAAKSYGLHSINVAKLCEHWAQLHVENGVLDPARELWLFAMEIYKHLKNPRLATVIRLYMDSIREQPEMKKYLDEIDPPAVGNTSSTAQTRSQTQSA